MRERLAKRMESILIALAIAVGIPLGNALMTLDGAALDNPGPWVRSTITGIAGAVGAVFVGLSRAPKA